jgi:iron complex transport system substrate-binding protein
MATLSATHIGMLSVIGELDCIKGSTAADFVSNKTVRYGIRTGSITEFPDEASITPERLLKKEISLVMYSGFGKEFPNGDKLKKLGVLAMPNYDWREEHPLGKAEWIKVFGYLTGQEEKAAAYFEKVEKTYKKLKAEIGNPGNKPVVLVGSLIGDVWYAPAGESYMATILRDAGTDYLYKNEKGTGSCEHTLEQVFKTQEKASIWLNPGAVSLSDLSEQQSKYALFSAFRAGNVYCYTHNSNYFWEMSAVNPHWTLEDLSAIAGTRSGQKLHFYRKLAN